MSAASKVMTSEKGLRTTAYMCVCVCFSWLAVERAGRNVQHRLLHQYTYVGMHNSLVGGNVQRRL